MNSDTRGLDSLVSTDWLENNLGRNDLVVVDIRGYVNAIDQGGGRQTAEYTGAPDEYAEAHIPGAVFVDWTVDIVDPESEVAAQIASPEQFAESMSQRGVGNETRVVAVDHSGGHFATRLWWALKYHGHDNVAVLDGGFKKWEREGRPLTDEPTVSAFSEFVPSMRPELRVSVEEVIDAIGSGTSAVVDARDEQTYSGEAYRGSRAGHIPRAKNLPAKSLFNNDGTWKSDDDLRNAIGETGVDGNVIAYCNGGVTATAVLFALDRLGRTDWSNYDGSWNEWGERPDLPVETGATGRPGEDS